MFHSKFFKRTAALVLALVLAASLIWAIPSSAEQINDATVKSYEAQIAELTAQQEELLQKLKETEDSISTAMERKQYVDQLIKSTSKKIQTAQSMIDDLDKQIEAKEALVKETEEKISAQRQAFLDRMAALHEDGNASYLELILGSTDIASMLTKIDYVNSMMEYDQKVIADLTSSKTELDKTLETLAASKDAQKAALALLEEEQSNNSALANESEAIIQQLNEDNAAWQSQYDNAVAAEKQLDAELQQYIKEQQEANRNNPIFNAGATDESGNIYIGSDFAWPIPVGGSSYGYISSHFGWRELNGYQDYHAATDIAAPHGTEIYASNGGVVLRSEWHDSYGYYVLIDHGNGISTLYAHMSLLNVSAGQTVSQGQVIGYVGNTGYSFGAHLHFEYRINGERVDAEQYVASPY